MSDLRIVPVDLADAKAFVDAHHRHHEPPVGMWADGDRRLRADEIALNVFGRRPSSARGQLWERVSGSVGRVLH